MISVLPVLLSDFHLPSLYNYSPNHLLFFSKLSGPPIIKVQSGETLCILKVYLRGFLHRAAFTATEFHQLSAQCDN